MQRKSTSETLGNAFTMERKGRQREIGNSLGNHRKYRKGIAKCRLGKIKCWSCGKRGHLEKDYRAPKKKGDEKHKTTQEANVAGDVLQDALILELDITSDYWVVYSWASCHATPHMKLFHDYVLGDFGHVLLGG